MVPRHDPSTQTVRQLCSRNSRQAVARLAASSRATGTSGSFRRAVAANASGAGVRDTAQGCRIATSVGGVGPAGVPTSSSSRPAEPEEALSQNQRQAATEWYTKALQAAEKRQVLGCECDHATADEDDLAGHVDPRAVGVGGCSALPKRTTLPGRTCVDGKPPRKGARPLHPESEPDRHARADPPPHGRVQLCRPVTERPRHRAAACQGPRGSAATRHRAAGEISNRLVQSWGHCPNKASELSISAGADLGIKGKDLYLACKYAAQAHGIRLNAGCQQCGAFEASVVLIEEQGLGTS